MKPVRDLCVCACVLAVCCEIRHLVSWSLCCPSTQHNRPLFTAPPTAIKHACLSVSVYVCVIIASIPAFSFSFFPPLFHFLCSLESKFKRFLSVGKMEEFLFASFSLFESLLSVCLLPLICSLNINPRRIPRQRYPQVLSSPVRATLEVEVSEADQWQ